MKPLHFKLVVILMIGCSISLLWDNPGQTANPKITPRQLEIDQQEQTDDKAIYGSSDLQDGVSLSHQLVMATIDKSPLNFNENIVNIQSQLDIVRRNIDSTIPNNVRVSALSAYINNALLMNKLGLLSATDDESLINTQNSNTLSVKKVRKLTRRIPLGENLNSRMHRNGKYFRIAKLLPRDRRARLYYPNSRKLMRVKTVSQLQDQVQVPQDRKLYQTTYDVIPPSKIRHKKAHNYHLPQIEKLRQNDELIQLAKTGNLFKLDFASVYDISSQDMDKYMLKDSSTKPNGI